MASRYEAPDDDLDDPPVQCWHTEPNTTCDWDICRQPERLAVGDYGTDPAEGDGGTACDALSSLQA